MFWWITLRTFVNNISARFQKMHVRPLQRKFLITIFFFFEKSSCLSTEVERKIFWCSVQTFWQCGQNCFLRVQGRFLTNLFFSATFSSFSFGFRTVRKKNIRSRSLAGKFRRVVKSAFQASRRDFCGNCSSKNFLNCLNIFVFQAKNVRNYGLFFRQVRQKCILCVHSRFLSELYSYVFFEFLFVFGLWGKNSATMTQEALESLSELQSKCTKEISAENLFFVEKLYFYNFFELWSKTLRFFVEKHSIRFQELLSTLVQGNFLHNIILFFEKFYAY